MANNTKAKRELLTLAQGVVLAQGNVYIKELLRKKGIKIGATKAEFEANMLDAIEQKKLTLDDFDAWLDEVEGWGDQHVYLYKLPDLLANTLAPSEHEAIRNALINAGLGAHIDAKTSLAFPAELELTGIFISNEAIRMVWHQGRESWARAKKMDERREIDGDHYRFDAYRRRAERAVMRFEVRPREKLAAVFMQIPWDKSEHLAALHQIAKASESFITWADMEQFSTSDAIKKMDDDQLRQQGRVGGTDELLTAHKTRLSDASAYVEFANTSQDHGYGDSGAVREVRLAVQGKKFSGTNGVFTYRPRSGINANSQIKIELFGTERRIRIWAQLKATEVWEVINRIRSYG